MGDHERIARAWGAVRRVGPVPPGLQLVRVLAQRAVRTGPQIKTMSGVGLTDSVGAGTASETEQEFVRRELRELRDLIDRVNNQANQQIDAVEKALAQADARLAERIAEIEKRHSAERSGALRREHRAAQLFMLGVVFSLVSALV